MIERTIDLSFAKTLIEGINIEVNKDLLRKWIDNRNDYKPYYLEILERLD